MKQLRYSALALLGTLVSCGEADQSIVTQQACLTLPVAPVLIDAAKTKIGSNASYHEEGPEYFVKTSSFNIDATEVTNAMFARFVMETGYVTEAEKDQAGFGKPGAAVFTVPSGTNSSWWAFIEGAQWRHPEGPGSSIKGRDNDPVVQVSYNDANAYAAWAGRRLPTQDEWEYAARAGSETRFIWGNERNPQGKHMANTWQGAFPLENTIADGFGQRAPAGCYPANNFGLYDMVGNVWEWTDTPYRIGGRAVDNEAVYTIKGGSFLCAENYCRRYTGTSRQPQEAGLPTNHIGFRTVKSKE